MEKIINVLDYSKGLGRFSLIRNGKNKTDISEKFAIYKRNKATKVKIGGKARKKIQAMQFNDAFVNRISLTIGTFNALKSRDKARADLRQSKQDFNKDKAKVFSKDYAKIRQQKKENQERNKLLKMINAKYS